MPCSIPWWTAPGTHWHAFPPEQEREVGGMCFGVECVLGGLFGIYTGAPLTVATCKCTAMLLQIVAMHSRAPDEAHCHVGDRVH